jgi:hypothetical protein
LILQIGLFTRLPGLPRVRRPGQEPGSKTGRHGLPHHAQDGEVTSLVEFVENPKDVNVNAQPGIRGQIERAHSDSNPVFLDRNSNVQNMHSASSDKPVAFYSLDTIISVGYRVKSKQGRQPLGNKVRRAASRFWDPRWAEQ